MTRPRRDGPRFSRRAGDALAALQLTCALRSFGRMAATGAGDPIRVATAPPAGSGEVGIVVPVLDERRRLGACLDGLIAQGPWVREILVIDGGSRDGTQALAVAYAERDPRVRVFDASPVPPGWNGKAWGLQVGLERQHASVRWFLAVDADVRVAPDFAASLVTHATATWLDVFSAAPALVVPDPLQGILHPALLATLVYRTGLPGNVATSPAHAQADGQCFFAARKRLLATQPFVAAKRSRCEDVTVARRLVESGVPVGFFEAGALARVEMYASAAECWRNWPRSLPLRDDRSRLRDLLGGLAEIALVQALPLALTLATATRRESSLFRVNAALLAARLGVLAGTRRAYAQVPSTFWLSPLADLAVAAVVARSTFAKRHAWRGRTLVGGEPVRW